MDQLISQYSQNRTSVNRLLDNIQKQVSCCALIFTP